MCYEQCLCNASMTLGLKSDAKGKAAGRGCPYSLPIWSGPVWSSSLTPQGLSVMTWFHFLHPAVMQHLYFMVGTEAQAR